MPQKSFVVLGVSHRVQGDKDVFDAFHDSGYAAVVKEIISNDHIDFVGEEWSDSTSIAETVTQSVLGAGRYLNVSPSIKDIERYGLGEKCHGSSLGVPLVMYWDISDNEKLEQIWVDQLTERTAARGLLICGVFHTFSVSAKMLNRGFEIEARTYMPWDKLAQ